MSRNTNPWHTIYFRGSGDLHDRDSMLRWASNFGSSAIDVQGWIFFPVKQLRIRRVQPRRR